MKKLYLAEYIIAGGVTIGMSAMFNSIMQSSQDQYEQNLDKYYGQQHVYIPQDSSDDTALSAAFENGDARAYRLENGSIFMIAPNQNGGVEDNFWVSAPSASTVNYKSMQAVSGFKAVAHMGYIQNKVYSGGSVYPCHPEDISVLHTDENGTLKRAMSACDTEDSEPLGDEGMGRMIMDFARMQGAIANNTYPPVTIDQVDLKKASLIQYEANDLEEVHREINIASLIIGGIMAIGIFGVAGMLRSERKEDDRHRERMAEIYKKHGLG